MNDFIESYVLGFSNWIENLYWAHRITVHRVGYGLAGLFVLWLVLNLYIRYRKTSLLGLYKGRLMSQASIPMIAIDADFRDRTEEGQTFEVYKQIVKRVVDHDAVETRGRSALIKLGSATVTSKEHECPVCDFTPASGVSFRSYVGDEIYLKKRGLF